jgi:23S rRNA (cytidine1920-2'-O)/16S rRNA (cytidine1409-2'-O)-methyltransferase
VKRQRLDTLLVESGRVASRERARRLVMAGAVRVGDCIVDKPSALVDPEAAIEVVDAESRFVSRGGLKLEAALNAFHSPLEGAFVLDVGASTGGFTDCVLQRGARAVYAVDVGYGQFAWSLRNDPRVTLRERTNVRNLSPRDLPEAPSLAVVDVSFISLRLVLPVLVACVRPGGEIITLVKPQFEVGKGQVGKGGVVRDAQLQGEVVERVRSCGVDLGLRYVASCESPILGPKGNREFFLDFHKAPGAVEPLGPLS